MQTVDVSKEDIQSYLARHQRKELLRFLTCGSVYDGKSTLIGRLLHDSKTIYEDQLAAVKKDSVKHGTTGEGQIDLALLTDGLRAELILVNPLRVMQQPPNQRRLPIIHRPASQKPQQLLPLMPVQVRMNIFL